MNTSLVSVILPAYNAEKYIHDAVNSVFTQENVSVELILINDASTDRTLQEMQKYAHFSNVTILNNKTNLGVAESRNKGIALAKGRYIAFLDTDDWWSSDKLIKQIQLLRKKDCVLTYTARELFDDNGSSTGNIISVPEQITYEELLKHNIINCSSVLMLTKVAQEFYMQHDDSHEDYLMWLKVLQKYEIAYGINEPLLKYRLSIGGKSRNKLKSAVMNYRVHRYLGTNPVKSLYYMSSQLVQAGRKYLNV